MNKKCVAAARTLLFNYGQGLWTPHGVYRDCCFLLDEKPWLSPLPSFQKIWIGISFFSKESSPQFELYFHREEEQFIALPDAIKLNWLRNFTSMQEILFNFSAEEHITISTILREWKRPAYDYESIPFSSARISTFSNTRQSGIRECDPILTAEDI